MASTSPQRTAYKPYAAPEHEEAPAYQPSTNAYAQPEAAEKAGHSEPPIAPTDYESFKDASAAEAGVPAPVPQNRYGAPAPVPGARSSRFTKTALILHCVFLVFGTAQLGVTAYMLARGQAIIHTVDIASLVFLLMAIVSMLTDASKIFWIAKRNMLPPRTMVLDILVIITGLFRFIRVFYYNMDGLYGDTEASYRFRDELWVELLVALGFFVLLSFARVVSIVLVVLWNRREKRAAAALHARLPPQQYMPYGGANAADAPRYS
ncbi:hypothetical protein VHEMI07502 [[Torrubiella] hemipterigena]|uniref:Uncharacterized protein n=1 Tax=[Torrubiella] hemipterigena TaxID=1531966 RepID=A0A0A1TN19_9HYPO|nr:hypothetical protein VHEMI07502 [[Torrubiella] hemipterigena]